MLGILLFLISSGNKPLLAMMSTDGKPLSPSFVIRQEKSRSQGVLVSRPNELDQKIRDFIIHQELYTIEQYAQWVKKDILYQKDSPLDTWSSPLETLRKKTGDCEDYALLHSAVLRVMGYHPHFIAVNQPKGAHAICFFEYNGFFFWFDNNRLLKSTEKNLEKFLTLLTSRYHSPYLLEFNFEDSNWQVLFKRS